jgi:hypothetical protein
VGQLVNAERFDLKHGMLCLTNQAVTIEPKQFFRDRLQLEPTVVLNVAGGATNQGLIEGSRILSAALITRDCEIRAETGNSLTFTGAIASKGDPTPRRLRRSC